MIERRWRVWRARFAVVAVACVFTGVVTACRSSNAVTPAQGAVANGGVLSPPTARTAERQVASTVLSEWSAGPQLAGAEMIAEYGEPAEITADRMIWHDAAPFKRIMLTREQLPHDFPLTHTDYLEHTISYKVPADKADEVHAFDASITIHPGSGELSARCDLESNNILTLNLAYDIVNGRKTVDQARKEFGQAVTERTLGHAPASTQALQFQPMNSALAAEREQTTIAGTPQRGEGSRAVATNGSESSRISLASSDAELLALLIALDENEVRAAMIAERKKGSEQATNFVRRLHEDHGKNIQQTQLLGIGIGMTPRESAGVDQIRDGGALQLAKLVPLTGDDFWKAFDIQMASGHRDALKKLDQWTARAQNPAVKEHLITARQHVQAHLQEVEKLQGRR